MIYCFSTNYHQLLLITFLLFLSIKPKFGYLPTAKFEIKLPFDTPPENCMAIELVEKGLKGVTGTVEYSKEFFE